MDTQAHLKDIILLRVINHTLLNVCSDSYSLRPSSRGISSDKRTCRDNLANCSIEGYYGSPQPVYVQQRAGGESAADDLCCGMYVPNQVPCFA